MPHSLFLGKQGYLKKKGNAVKKDWKKRYVVLDDIRLSYYESYEQYYEGNPLKVIDTLTASVKVDDAMPNRFEFITVHKTFVFQTESIAETEEWVRAIKNSIELRINNNGQVMNYLIAEERRVEE